MLNVEIERDWVDVYSYGIRLVVWLRQDEVAE